LAKRGDSKKGTTDGLTFQGGLNERLTSDGAKEVNTFKTRREWEWKERVEGTLVLAG